MTKNEAIEFVLNIMHVLSENMYTYVDAQRMREIIKILEGLKDD